MLIYAFVALVIVICLILYKFFAVVETLVDEHSTKKEDFSNFNEVNDNVEVLIKNRGSTTIISSQTIRSKTINKSYKFRYRR